MLVISVSSLRNPVTRDGFSFSPQCESVSHSPGKKPGTEPVILDCVSESTLLMLDHFSQRCASMGVEVRPEELRELGMFTSFTIARVKQSEDRGVSCMSLWAEWVRYFLKRMNSFPSLIYENEFRDLILNRFDCAISVLENDGPVYSGIEFVPERNIAIHIADSGFAQA